MSCPRSLSLRWLSQRAARFEEGNKEQRRAAWGPGNGGHTVWKEYRTELA